MARKTSLWTATVKRDAGKLFFITEMSAAHAEDWAVKAFLALMQAKVDLPPGVTDLGMAGLAEIGFEKLSQIPFHILKPLMNELMDCAHFIPDKNVPHVHRSINEETGDIEEVATLLQLKYEVLKVHIDFSETVEPLISKVKETIGAAAGPIRSKMSRK